MPLPEPPQQQVPWIYPVDDAIVNHVTVDHVTDHATVDHVTDHVILPPRDYPALQDRRTSSIHQTRPSRVSGVKAKGRRLKNKLTECFSQKTGISLLLLVLVTTLVLAGAALVQRVHLQREPGQGNTNSVYTRYNMNSSTLPDQLAEIPSYSRAGFLAGSRLRCLGGSTYVQSLRKTAIMTALVGPAIPARNTSVKILLAIFLVPGTVLTLCFLLKFSKLLEALIAILARILLMALEYLGANIGQKVRLVKTPYLNVIRR